MSWQQVVVQRSAKATDAQHATQAGRWAIERQVNSAIAVAIMDGGLYHPDSLVLTGRWRQGTTGWMFTVQAALPTQRPRGNTRNGAHHEAQPA